MFQRSLTGRNGSGSGFGSWKTVPAVPVPLSVSGKTVPTVLVSGSGSVPEPPAVVLEAKLPTCNCHFLLLHSCFVCYARFCYAPFCGMAKICTENPASTAWSVQISFKEKSHRYGNSVSTPHWHITDTETIADAVFADAISETSI